MAARYAAGQLSRGKPTADELRVLVDTRSDLAKDVQAYRDLADDVAMSGTMDTLIRIADQANL